MYKAVEDPGEPPPPPTLFLDPTEARKAEVTFFSKTAPGLSQGLDDHPPLYTLTTPPLYTLTNAPTIS